MKLSKYISFMMWGRIHRSCGRIQNYVHREALNLLEFENIDGEIRRLIEKIDRQTAYFAVSVLGTNPINIEIKEIVKPVRVDEPVIWLLNQLGYIDGKEY